MYHEGELRVQERAGVRQMASRIGRSIHPEIPDRAANFLSARRRLVVTTLDDERRPWVTILTGAPGFVGAPDPRTLRIASLPDPSDPARAGLEPGKPIGTLAIDFARRHRSRVNGTIRSVGGGVLLVDVEEAYANCPKYIQRRPEPGPADGLADDDAAVPLTRRGTELTDAQLDLVREADTFFIGTVAPGVGADASHRGGNPGFVQATNRTVVWPDYTGNSMFNTLGNVEAYPWAGLAFVDVTAGVLVQITGTAEIDWNPRRIAEFPGAERLVRLRVRQVVEREKRLPGPWEVVEYSPFNPEAPGAGS